MADYIFFIYLLVFIYIYIIIYIYMNTFEKYIYNYSINSRRV